MSNKKPFDDEEIPEDNMTFEEALHEAAWGMENIPSRFFAQKEFILQAFPHCREDVSWHYIDKFLQNDIDIIYMGLQQSIINLNDLPPYYLENDELVLHAFKYYPYNIEYMPEKWIKNKEWMLNALSEDGFLYPYVAHEYENDMEITFIASLSYPETITYCSDQLKQNRKIAENCINLNPSMIQFVSKELLKDISFCKLVIDRCCNYDANVIHHLPIEVLDNQELMTLVMKKTPKAFKFLSERLRDNLDFIKSALQADITSKAYIPWQTMETIREFSELKKSEFTTLSDIDFKKVVDVMILADELNTNSTTITKQKKYKI